ncbi:MAG: flagellar rod assembly protein/muramidase FlgJ [Hydrogenophilales bacterium 28-61-23]|nr:MAG: flagellar rod assembly protein/muramidase FlgJ [Hydrogenophilales bacterium 28-61-23]
MIAGTERLAIDVADAQALKARAVSGDPGALRSAARQFESLMMAQMLKTMRETRFSEEDDPMTGGDGVKLYRELLDQQWASKLSSGRGLGFAEMMVKAMESRGMNAGTTPEASPLSIPAADSTVRPDPVEGQGFDRFGLNGITRSANPLPQAADPMKGTAQTAATIPVTANASNRKQTFLETMKPHAEAAAATTGVPSRFILAHAALESGWGEREIRGENGEASHNLFGIKAGRNWEGASVQTLTTEYRQGIPMKLSQSFRAYDDYSAGFTDYAMLLKSRYGAALSEGADSHAFASGLAAGGYATDPAYAGKLKAVIASVAMAGG